MRLSQYHKANIVSISVTLSATFSAMFMFSYLPEMTLYFGYPEHDKGYYVGLISSAYSLGTLLSSYTLGKLSDVHGHHKMMIIVQLSSAAFCLITSFCRDIYSVIAIRFLCGSGNAVLGISCAMLSRHSDNSNQVTAMILHNVAWALGLISGSAIGGFLSSPAIKYPGSFYPNGFFARFPFALSPILACVLNLISTLVTYFLYPYENDAETIKLIDDRHIKQAGNIAGNFCQDNNGRNVTVLNERSITENDEKSCSNDMMSCVNNKPSCSNDIKSYADEKKCCANENKSCCANNMKSSSNEKESCATNIIDRIKQSTIVELLVDTNVIKCCLITFLTCVATTYIDLTSVWESTAPDLQGLGYTSEQIGTILSIIVVPSIVIYVLIFPLVTNKVGLIKSYSLFTVLSMIMVTIVPTCRRIENKQAQWWCLLVCHMLMNVFRISANAAILVLINNCVHRSLLGALNGLQMISYSAMNILGPPVTGAIFAASVMSDIGSPIDYNLAFVVMGLSLFVGSIITFSLPDRLNSKYKKPDASIRSPPPSLAE